MGKRILIALEEELEVTKLYEAEQAAAKSGEFDLLYNQTKNDKEIEESESSSNDVEDNSEEDLKNDASNDTESKATDSESESVSETTETNDEVVQESFRNLTYSEISLEDFDNYSNDEKTVGEKVIGAIGNAFKQSFSYLKHLGITYGPTVAKNVYKGVIFVMGRLTHLLLKSMVDLTKYLNRRINSFNKLKEDISDVKKSITEIKSKKEQVDLTDSKFSNVRTINILKIGDSVDFSSNVKVLTDFTENTVNQIDKGIATDIGSIKHLISMSNSNTVNTPLKLLKTSISLNNLKSGVLPGYEVKDNSIEGYYSDLTLPGDVVLIAHLPNKDINSLEDTVRAYNNSSLFLGINTGNFKSIENIDYMTVSDLEDFLNQLEKLCDVCITHQRLYENVIRNKSGLRYNFKNYFNSIINSGKKISLNNSLIEYIYLKSMFIDKVYLASAMDIHDYSIKVITNSLSFIKDNIKKL